MTQVDDVSGGNRKTLPMRKARKASPKPISAKTATGRRALVEVTDPELIRAFDQK